MSEQEVYKTRDEFRKGIIGRDGGTCQYCGSEYEALNGIQAHHILPVSEGGEHTSENGVALCKLHHNAVHAISNGGECPMSLLEENEVPKNLPKKGPLKNYTTRQVIDALRDEGMANPNLIREITGLERQRINDALQELVAAGWVDRRTRGLYEIVYDGVDYLERRLVYKEER